MYKDFENYMTDFIDENSSPDFWYDVAMEEAGNILSSFSYDDWSELIINLNNKPIEYKRKLASCLYNADNKFELMVLLNLVNTDDEELHTICMDSLRSFSIEKNKDAFLKNKIIVENICKFKTDSNMLITKIYNDLMEKIDKLQSKDFAQSFRIAVNTNKEDIIEILEKYFKNIKLNNNKHSFELNGNHAKIKENENCDPKLSIISNNRNAFLYYENKIDFFAVKDDLTLYSQKSLVSELLNIFMENGVKAELVSEFEYLI